MVETYAASYASAETNWIRCLLLSILFGDFDIMTQRPRHFPAIEDQPIVLRTDRPEVIDPDVSLLSDSKGLYDALNNELPQGDKELLSTPHYRGYLEEKQRSIEMDTSQ